jgi:cation diffusion facilitator CzcD-associated flavoprotein CzcO
MGESSVLVAGAGLAGLAVARALRSRGIRAVISERTAQPTGVRSTVRESIFPGLESRSAVISTGSFRIMAPNPGIDCYTAWSGVDSTILLIPVDEDEVYVFASAAGGAQR